MQIYIIEARAVPPCYKIGVSGDVQARLSGIATSCPHPLSLVAAMDHPNCRRVERSAHEALSAHRLRGEWFGCSQAEAQAAVEAAMREAEPLVEAAKTIPQWRDGMPLTPGSFAAALRTYRERLRLTLPDMARLLSISERCLWQWENAVVAPLSVSMEGALKRLKKAELKTHS